MGQVSRTKSTRACDLFLEMCINYHEQLTPTDGIYSYQIATVTLRLHLVHMGRVIELTCSLSHFIIRNQTSFLLKYQYHEIANCAYCAAILLWDQYPRTVILYQIKWYTCSEDMHDGALS